jgi:hypothetical protein
MRLAAPNITLVDGRVTKVTRSALPYNDRRRFGNRLRRLYAYLGGLKPSQYNHDSLVSGLAPKAPACGTIACAFGHAVTSGKFKDIPMAYSLRRGAKPDAKGMFDETDINYRVQKSAVRQEVKARGLKPDTEGFYHGMNSINSETAADAYFGPGAWANIFDIDAYPWSGNGKATKAVVMRRIKDIAEKAYGVKVTA